MTRVRDFHQVAEIPPIQPTVTEYRLHRLPCPRCGTSTCGAVPPGVPTGAFGPRLHSLLSLLAGGYRRGQRPIRQLARDLFGLSLSLGMVAKLRQQTGAVLERPVAELRDHVRQAEVVHIDETSWREDRAKAWLWVALTPMVTVFTIAAARRGGVARQIFGAVARRVIVSDRFPSYGWIEVRQFCWAHLRRDFQAMIDRGGESAEVGRQLLGHSNKLFHWWHRVRDGTMARLTRKGYTDPLRWAVRQDLQRGAACSCAKTAATCRELLAGEAHLWTFLRVAGVDPTNNAAERALRHAVIWRKTSGGTEGDSGSPFVERILSVVATCLPLLKDIDIGDQLSRGQWTVVFYRHNCSLCRKALPKYERLARESAGRADASRIALIEVPPHGLPGEAIVSRESPCVLGRLSDAKVGSLPTPTAIMLKDCIVQPKGS